MTTLAQLEDKVRRMCGRPDTTEMPESTVHDFIQDALDWLNQRKPSETIDSFATVAEQQYYDEKPANAYEVTDVWWDACDNINLGDGARLYAEGYQMNQKLAGFSVEDNPALVEIFFKQIEAYKESFGGEGWEQEDGTIGLFPCPGSAGETVYFRYTHSRYADVTVIPDGPHMTALKKKAASMVLEQLFIMRGRVRSGARYSGGGGANERIQADKYEREAEEAVPIPLALFDRG